MRPIFGALTLTLIIFFTGTETADRSSKVRKRESYGIRNPEKYIKTMEEAEARKKKEEEDKKALSETLKTVNVRASSSKGYPKPRDFSQMLQNFERAQDSSSTYGTSRATQRQLLPKPQKQPLTNFALNPGPTRGQNNMLPTFDHARNQLGGFANQEHVPGGMYMDNEGHYYQLPQHPSPLIGSTLFDQLHEYNSAIPRSGSSSYPQSTQNYGHDNSFQSSGAPPPNWYFSDPLSTQTFGQGFQNHESSYSLSAQNHNNDNLLQSYATSLPSLPPLPPSLPYNQDYDHFLQSHGGLLPSGPSSQHQDFQHQESHNYYSSESPGINHLNEYLRNQHPPHSGGSGSGHGSSYPYQE